jgi:hypothetical protein
MKRILLSLLFLAAGTAALAVESRVALLIANGAYRNFSSLAGPVAEARALADALEKLGFQVQLVENANREQTLDALDALKGRVKGGGGIAFFHYGGHGVQAGGKNYLIPVDADIPDERKVATRAVDIDEVMSSLDACGSDTNLVVLDACRNNPLPAGAGRSASRGLSVIAAKPKNSVIVYSAEAGTVALDGVFTPTLASLLASPGRSFSDILVEVRKQVYEKTKGAQIPGEYNQLFSNVYLNGNTQTVALAKPAEAAPANAAMAGAALPAGELGLYGRSLLFQTNFDTPELSGFEKGGDPKVVFENGRQVFYGNPEFPILSRQDCFVYGSTVQYIFSWEADSKGTFELTQARGKDKWQSYIFGADDKGGMYLFKTNMVAGLEYAPVKWREQGFMPQRNTPCRVTFSASPDGILSLSVANPAGKRWFWQDTEKMDPKPWSVALKAGSGKVNLISYREWGVYDPKPDLRAKFLAARDARNAVETINVGEQYLALDASDYEVNYFVGDAYFGQKMHVAALPYFQAAAKADPKNPWPLHRASECFLNSGESLKAYEWSVKALAVDPKHGWSYHDIVKAAFELKKWDVVKKYLDIGLKTNYPKNGSWTFR